MCVECVCVFIYIYNVVFGIRTSPGVEWWEMVETRGGGQERNSRDLHSFHLILLS